MFVLPGCRLPDAIFRHQTRRPGCKDFFKAFDHTEVHLLEAALPYRHGSSLCRSRFTEGLPGYQLIGVLFHKSDISGQQLNL